MELYFPPPHTMSIFWVHDSFKLLSIAFVHFVIPKLLLVPPLDHLQLLVFRLVVALLYSSPIHVANHVT